MIKRGLFSLLVIVVLCASTAAQDGSFLYGFPHEVLPNQQNVWTPGRRDVRL